MTPIRLQNFAELLREKMRIGGHRARIAFMVLRISAIGCQRQVANGKDGRRAVAILRERQTD